MFRRASFRELLLSLRILTVAVLVPVIMRLPLRQVGRLIEPRRARRPADPAAVVALIERIEAVLTRGRPLVRTGCLTRAVTLFYFLRRAGVDVTLAFGMGRPRAEFEGHCWLIKDGRPFLERVDPSGVFTEIYSIPVAGA
jgi:transglutaminase superfamily protein